MTSRGLLHAKVICVRKVTPGDGQSAAYHAGRLPPRYPVPAIIVEYEYGQRWPSGKVVLIECIRGPYDDNDGPYRQWLSDNGWR